MNPMNNEADDCYELYYNINKIQEDKVQLMHHLILSNFTTIAK